MFYRSTSSGRRDVIVLGHRRRPDIVVVLVVAVVDDLQPSEKRAQSPQTVFDYIADLLQIVNGCLE